jgi:hypothetical protein
LHGRTQFTGNRNAAASTACGGRAACGSRAVGITRRRRCAALGPGVAAAARALGAVCLGIAAVSRAGPRVAAIASGEKRADVGVMRHGYCSALPQRINVAIKGAFKSE